MEVLSNRNVVANASAVLIRSKNIKDNFFYFIQNYKMCGDWFFWILLLENNNILYSPQRMNFFRTHSQTTRSNLTAKQQLLRFLEEIAIKQYINSKYKSKIDLRINWKTVYRFASFKNYKYFINEIQKLDIDTLRYYKVLFFYFSIKNGLSRAIKKL
jgi:hypothetical protein